MKILLAVDDSAFSEAATKAVIDQTKPGDLEVHVLHTFEPMAFLPGFAGESVAESLKAAEERRRADAKGLLARTAQTLDKAGFKVTTSLVEADPRHAIIDQAEKWKADLIVVGSHGRKGLDRLLIGSVAEHVARHASCSVKIVRPSGNRIPTGQGR
jgi:nucleotide-binding universal stress UspA family protein